VEADVEKKKTTTITSETHEFVIVRRPLANSIRMWCDECDAEVDMLRAEEAAAVADVSTRTIYRWIEAGQIHHTESGDVLICPNGLLR
jgi:excisionase family DNA binding protein